MLRYTFKNTFARLKTLRIRAKGSRYYSASSGKDKSNKTLCSQCKAGGKNAEKDTKAQKIVDMCFGTNEPDRLQKLQQEYEKEYLAPFAYDKNKEAQICERCGKILEQVFGKDPNKFEEKYPPKKEILLSTSKNKKEKDVLENKVEKLDEPELVEAEFNYEPQIEPPKVLMKKTKDKSLDEVFDDVFGEKTPLGKNRLLSTAEQRRRRKDLAIIKANLREVKKDLVRSNPSFALNKLENVLNDVKIEPDSKKEEKKKPSLEEMKSNLEQLKTRLTNFKDENAVDKNLYPVLEQELDNPTQVPKKKVLDGKLKKEIYSPEINVYMAKQKHVMVDAKLDLKQVKRDLEQMKPNFVKINTEQGKRNPYAEHIKRNLKNTHQKFKPKKLNDFAVSKYTELQQLEQKKLKNNIIPKITNSNKIFQSECSDAKPNPIIGNIKINSGNLKSDLEDDELDSKELDELKTKLPDIKPKLTDLRANISNMNVTVDTRISDIGKKQKSNLERMGIVGTVDKNLGKDIAKDGVASKLSFDKNEFKTKPSFLPYVQNHLDSNSSETEELKNGRSYLLPPHHYQKFNDCLEKEEKNDKLEPSSAYLPLLTNLDAMLERNTTVQDKTKVKPETEDKIEKLEPSCACSPFHTDLDAMVERNAKIHEKIKETPETDESIFSKLPIIAETVKNTIKQHFLKTDSEPAQNTTLKEYRYKPKSSPSLTDETELQANEIKYTKIKQDLNTTKEIKLDEPLKKSEKVSFSTTDTIITNLRDNSSNKEPNMLSVKKGPVKHTATPGIDYIQENKITPSSKDDTAKKPISEPSKPEEFTLDTNKALFSWPKEETKINKEEITSTTKPTEIETTKKEEETTKKEEETPTNNPVAYVVSALTRALRPNSAEPVKILTEKKCSKELTPVRKRHRRMIDKDKFNVNYSSANLTSYTIHRRPRPLPYKLKERPKSAEYRRTTLQKPYLTNVDAKPAYTINPSWLSTNEKPQKPYDYNYAQGPAFVYTNTEQSGVVKQDWPTEPQHYYQQYHYPYNYYSQTHPHSENPTKDQSVSQMTNTNNEPNDLLSVSSIFQKKRDVRKDEKPTNEYSFESAKSDIDFYKKYYQQLYGNISQGNDGRDNPVDQSNIASQPQNESPESYLYVNPASETHPGWTTLQTSKPEEGLFYIKLEPDYTAQMNYAHYGASERQSKSSDKDQKPKKGPQKDINTQMFKAATEDKILPLEHKHHAMPINYNAISPVTHTNVTSVETIEITRGVPALSYKQQSTDYVDSMAVEVSEYFDASETMDEKVHLPYSSAPFVCKEPLLPNLDDTTAEEKEAIDQVAALSSSFAPSLAKNPCLTSLDPDDETDDTYPNLTSDISIEPFDQQPEPVDAEPEPSYEKIVKTFPDGLKITIHKLVKEDVTEAIRNADSCELKEMETLEKTSKRKKGDYKPFWNDDGTLAGKCCFDTRISGSGPFSEKGKGHITPSILDHISTTINMKKNLNDTSKNLDPLIYHQLLPLHHFQQNNFMDDNLPDEIRSFEPLLPALAPFVFNLKPKIDSSNTALVTNTNVLESADTFDVYDGRKQKYVNPVHEEDACCTTINATIPDTVSCSEQENYSTAGNGPDAHTIKDSFSEAESIANSKSVQNTVSAVETLACQNMVREDKVTSKEDTKAHIKHKEESTNPYGRGQFPQTSPITGLPCDIEKSILRDLFKALQIKNQMEYKRFNKFLMPIAFRNRRVQYKDRENPQRELLLEDEHIARLRMARRTRRRPGRRPKLPPKEEPPIPIPNIMPRPCKVETKRPQISPRCPKLNRDQSATVLKYLFTLMAPIPLALLKRSNDSITRNS